MDLEQSLSTALRYDLTREPGRGRIPQATELFGSAAGNETGENRVCWPYTWTLRVQTEGIKAETATKSTIFFLDTQQLRVGCLQFPVPRFNKKCKFASELPFFET